MRPHAWPCPLPSPALLLAARCLRGLLPCTVGGRPTPGVAAATAAAAIGAGAAAAFQAAAAALPANGLPASGAVLAGTVLGLAVGFACGCGWGLLLGSSAPKATAALGRGLTRLATVAAAEAQGDAPSGGYALRARRRRE